MFYSMLVLAMVAIVKLNLVRYKVFVFLIWYILAMVAIVKLKLVT